MNKNQDLSFFTGKRIFVTGHTGFKGSWLTAILLKSGANVCGFSLPPEGRSHFSDLNLSDRMTSLYGDIRDINHLRDSIEQFQPEILLHLAAQPLVRLSYFEPVDTFSTNVIGTVNIMECVRQSKSIKSFVNITSDKCYENVEWIWGYRENDRVGGRDPYSASKGAAEIAFSAYERSYFDEMPNLGSATVRAGNVIGGGDWAIDRIIPDCIRAVENNEPLFLRSPNSTRPWQHVLEPLSGYLLLAEKLYNEPKKFGGAWNFGPSTDEIRTVHDVSKTVYNHLGRGRVEVATSQVKVHEANLLQLNCDKAHQILGWSPKWDVDETLCHTAEWYKCYLNKEDLSQVTESQIKEYFGA